MSDFELPDYEEMMDNDTRNNYQKSEVPDIAPIKDTNPNDSKCSQFITVGLIFILALAIGYIAYDQYTEYIFDKDQELTLVGMEQGAQEILVRIVELAITCEQIPIPVGNQTLNLIAVDCLNFGEQNG